MISLSSLVFTSENTMVLFCREIGLDTGIRQAKVQGSKFFFSYLVPVRMPPFLLQQVKTK